ncbi:MAG TPA: hypothetical protein VEZ43_00385 [Dongiaceae bacterium]|nr:hypothetical protein [Dongiaceae bacterium]
MRDATGVKTPLPFTVTRPVTSRQVSIAVESRDANLVFGKIVEEEVLQVSIIVPLIADGALIDLILPRKRLENG